MKSATVQFKLENNSLTHEQLRYFDKHGIIQFKGFIDKDTVAAVLQEVKQVERHLLGKSIQKVNGIPLKFGQDVNGAPLIQRIAFASHYSSVLKGLLGDSRLTALTQLLGKYEGRIGENEKDG